MMGHTVAGHPPCFSRKYSAPREGISLLASELPSTKVAARMVALGPLLIFHDYLLFEL